jgi:hypothetical protein
MRDDDIANLHLKSSRCGGPGDYPETGSRRSERGQHSAAHFLQAGVSEMSDLRLRGAIDVVGSEH